MADDETIRDAYRLFLGREPDPGGYEAYARGIASGALDRQRIAELFIHSDEFKARQTGGPEERSAINALVKFNTGMVVQGGPFRGMKMLDLSYRGDGDIAPKLLGTYEQELHPALEKFAGNRYDAIVDIGCAEGYFAVGLARMFPGTRVIAYDTDEGALQIAGHLAELNGCREQLVTSGFCDPDELKRIFRDHPRSLIIADCEGYEKTLFGDPTVSAAGRHSDIIIECHDLWDRSTTPTIQQAMKDTHEVTTVYACGRNPNIYDFLANLSDWDRFRAVWERRGARQNWLVCEARA